MALKKYLPYIILSIPVGIGIYLIIKSRSGSKGEDKQVGDPTKDSDVQNTSSGIRPAVSRFFPLKKGSKGEKVKELQQAILAYDKLLLPKFGADSDFGSETEAAVQTLLGKKVVDSQDDIDSIKNRRAKEKSSADAAAAQKIADQNRLTLANKLVDMFKKKGTSNPYAVFVSLNQTGVGEGNVTTDGRLVNRATVIYERGTKLPLNKNVEFEVAASGMIRAKSGSNNDRKFYEFSPYAFEVKNK